MGGISGCGLCYLNGELTEKVSSVIELVIVAVM